jgi:ubiquinone/menaquinone biosynthesis C-methylase UbiE
LNEILPYYRQRAQEYEQIWHRDDPVRRGEQAEIAGALRDSFRNRRVLEVACGTGYWTQFVAEVADHITAIDAAPETLEVARAKEWPRGNVEFIEGDAYALQSISGSFNGGLANFWFSHIPKVRITEFLDGFHRRLGPGSVVFMADNMIVPGVGGELVKREGCEDTFKLRTLADGSKHEVLKNYFTVRELEQILSPHAQDLRIQMGKCFWWVKYLVK